MNVGSRFEIYQDPLHTKNNKTKLLPLDLLTRTHPRSSQEKSNLFSPTSFYITKQNVGVENVVIQRRFRSMIDSSLRDKYNNVCVSTHLNQIWGKFPILLFTLERDCRKFRGFELGRRIEVVEGD